MSTAPYEYGRTEALRAFHEVADDLLAREGLDAQVRFLPWIGPSGRTSVRCHVYAGSTGLFHGTPDWVWWSPVLETPEDLRVALEGALRTRPIVERRRNARPLPVLFPL